MKTYEQAVKEMHNKTLIREYKSLVIQLDRLDMSRLEETVRINQMAICEKEMLERMK